MGLRERVTCHTCHLERGQVWRLSRLGRGATTPGRSPQGQAWPRMGKSINPKWVLFSVPCK